MSKSELLKQIADGGPFDVADAIRELAKRAVVDEIQSVPAEPEVNAGDLQALLNVRLARALVTGGFKSVEDVRSATDESLLSVDGITEKGLAVIREKVGRGGV